MMCRTWWWVIGKDGDRTVLAGPKRSIEEANSLGYNMGCYFEVLELPTVDKARVAQIIKEQRLEAGQRLPQAMERVSHAGPDD